MLGCGELTLHVRDETGTPAQLDSVVGECDVVEQRARERRRCDDVGGKPSNLVLDHLAIQQADADDV